MIETKARAVPRKRFPVVLKRIADNVRAVGERARASPCAAAWCCSSRSTGGATTRGATARR